MTEKYIRVENYCMRLRVYPNKTQAQKIHEILDGLRLAYNITLYEMKCLNPDVVTLTKDGTAHWCDFKKAAKADWVNKLRERDPRIKCVPSAALYSSAFGLFCCDGQRAWESGFVVKTEGKDGKKKSIRIKKPTMEKWGDNIKFYSAKKPRTSFAVQAKGNKFTFAEDRKVVYITPTKNIGALKTRGWNNKILFGEDQLSAKDYFKTTSFGFSLRISVDACGDYWATFGIPVAWILVKDVERKPVGVDVGIKDLAILSDGTKFENPHFAKEEKKHKELVNRRLSRRQGWSNIKFRDAHKENKELKPSKTYERTKIKLAKLNRKILRKRKYWHDCISKQITDNASVVAIEDLNVGGMMKNRHLSYSLADAAMSSLLGKIKYKSAWKGCDIRKIGRFEPSSRTCSVCGHYMDKFGLDIREWTCPECGTVHDRDVNAAKNILQIGLTKTE